MYDIVIVVSILYNDKDVVSLKKIINAFAQKCISTAHLNIFYYTILMFGY